MLYVAAAILFLVAFGEIAALGIASIRMDMLSFFVIAIPMLIGICCVCFAGRRRR